MAVIGSLNDTERVLATLADRGYARRLGRRPGQKEDRFEQLLGGDGAPTDSTEPVGVPASQAPTHPTPQAPTHPASQAPTYPAPQAPTHPTPQAPPTTPASPAPHPDGDLEARVRALEADVAALRAELARLRQAPQPDAQVGSASPTK
jgi:uncharacterized protein YceH (UPF0502 family)